MNVLWAALAICLIVSFVFYFLTISWQRTLRGHSRAIRALFQRLESLESMEAPFLRQKIGEMTPSQLEEVCIFSLSFSERFWRRSLGMTETRACDIRENGTMMGSVKLDIWRRHISVKVTELLPIAKSMGWQERTMNIYASENQKPTVLWELCLEPKRNSVDGIGSSLQLRFRDKALELAILDSRTTTGAHSSDASDERIFLRVPLDAAELSEYRINDDNNSREFQTDEMAGDSAVSCFSDENEDTGIAWRLSIRALDGGVSDKWKFVEPTQAHRFS